MINEDFFFRQIFFPINAENIEYEKVIFQRVGVLQHETSIKTGKNQAFHLEERTMQTRRAARCVE